MSQTTTGEPTSQVRASPLRLLVLTPSVDSKTSVSPFPSFLQRLTTTSPSADINTFAGYTAHPPLYLKTRYYESNISIWCDELPLDDQRVGSASQNATPRGSSTTVSSDVNSSQKNLEEPTPVLADWSEQMLSESAKEVRDVIGGVVLLVPLIKPQSRLEKWLPYIEAVTSLRDTVEAESGRDIASLVVLQDLIPPTSTSDAKTAESLLERMEEEYLNTHGIMGWEYILWNPASDTTNAPTDMDSRNEHGEKTGFPRVTEVLSGIDWTSGPISTDLEDLDDNDDIMNDILGPDPISFLETDADADAGAETSTTPSKHSYNAINKSTLANLSSPRRTGSTTESLLGDDQSSFQRELLGFKMAMLDLKDPSSPAPSSLAGELDVGDMGLRTPIPPRSKLSRTISGSDVNVGTSVGSGDGAGEDEEVQVEQLTGLMERIAAMRQAAGGMKEGEREEFARREVNKIMKELG